MCTAAREPHRRVFFDGFNGCIFAYGQTGSGKTHTLMGMHMNGSDRAIDEASGTATDERELGMFS